MEYLVFWGCVAVFILFAVGREVVLDKHHKKDFEETLRKQYGILREREYSPDRFARIDSYYRKHPEENQLDDITWNDLGMDDVFKNMNYTYSAVGEEYLYYTLRSAGKKPEELQHFEEMVSCLRENEDARVYLQLWIAKLGYMGKYSLYDYLDHLEYLGERSNVRSILSDILYLPFIFLLPIQLPIGVCGIFALVIWNVISYFKEKKEIEPYIVSFMYILKMMDVGKELEKLPKEGTEPLAEELNAIRDAGKNLQAISRGSGVLLSGGGVVGGNPLEIVFDYIRMAFHVDLIMFNRMLRILREQIGAVDRMATGMGRLETAIAVGAWRTDLEKRGSGFCVPELASEEEAEEQAEGNSEREVQLNYNMQEGYHPLLSKPVKNSIAVEKGVLLTGSNASGKSTFLKTCAINAVLAQTIHTCTASSYKAVPFRIFSSMALRDDIESGDSYYIVEIKALKRILEAAGQKGCPVLCFVDEVLRGTNTVERIAASTQILKSLKKDNVLCFAATHDIELTDLLEQEYQNFHFEEEVRDGDIFFQYRLLDGKATSRNAIRLLEIIGYDEDIISNADTMAKEFLKNGTWA